MTSSGPEQFATLRSIDASSASMVSIMTALWFEQLRADDRVSVKPHASPMLHAINYLLGGLGESYLTTLREFGGLQSYPSRSKDPDGVDYSTGSVGIGATAPIWGALARRYVDQHFATGGSGRQYSLLGDAELDEGACWEAVLDPMVAELGELVWIVDLNRQSLDRVVPTIGATRLKGMFRAVQSRRGLASAPDWILDSVFGGERAAPLVSVLDGHPHTLAFLAGINRVPSTHLGVTSFGQSGDLTSVYRYHHIDADSIIRAALDLID